MKTIALGLTLLACGCGGHYQSLSSGATGCAPDEITISDFNQNGDACSWRASCNGKSFQCTETGSQQVYCAPST